MVIQHYNDFIETLLKSGFSMGGGSDEGIYSIVPFSWNEEHTFSTPIKWHTGDADTDPWEWRMRVLDERNDIAYGKLFFKKSGYISKEWYPYFLAVRREHATFEEAFMSGKISYMARKIYDVISAHDHVPLHAIKQLAGISKDNQSQFNTALVDLQMKLFITMCGRQQKISKVGNEYGWSSTVFCTTERFFEESVFDKALSLTKKDAQNHIREQILSLNPQADEKKLMKFING